MEVLDLSWNKLRRRGAVAVAKGVKVQDIQREFSLVWATLIIAFCLFLHQSEFFKQNNIHSYPE